MKTVEIPGVGTVDFPDSMTDEEVVAKAQTFARTAPRLLTAPGEVQIRGPQAPVTNLDDVTNAALSWMLKQGKQAALPTAGAVGGGLVGGLVASPTVAGVPAGVLGGEAAGSAFGEWLNQRLGITEPSVTQLGIAAAAPGAGRVIGGAARAGVGLGARFLPGSSVAANEQAVNIARNVPASIRIGSPASQLYDVVSQFNPKIATPNLSAALDTLGATEGQLAEGLQNPAIRRIVEGVQEQIRQAPNGQLDFQALRQTLKRIGERIGATTQTGGEEHGAYKLLSRAVHQDLEAAAAQGNPAMAATQALRAANDAARREFASDDLAAVIEKAWGTRPDGLVYLNPGKVLDFLKKNSSGAAQFKKSVTPEELTAITDTFEKLAKSVPQLPPRAGAQFGAGKALGLGTMGSATGYVVGGDPTSAAIGAAMAAYGPQVISRALMTDPGRRLVLKLMERGPFLDHRAAAILGAFTQSQLSTGAPE